jgi:hypothetical protein
MTALSASDGRLVKLVEIVAGNAPAPPWLELGLKAACFSVAYAHREATQQPGRKELREGLEKLRDAATHVLQTFTAPQRVVLRAIDDAAGLDIEGERQAWHSLHSLIERIDVTLAAIRPGRGRGKHDPGATGEEVCAMFVAVAWRDTRDTAAPYASADTNRACNVLWELATGETLPENANSTERWRERILNANVALELKDDPFVSTARRLLHNEHGSEWAEIAQKS